MNVLNLASSLDITSVAGQTLSSEEIYIIQNALLLLQNENDFKNIYFMGKVCGTDKDYYIAIGYRTDAIKGRTFYYSNNQHDWYVLSEPSPCALKLSLKVIQKFTGDPRHIIDGREANDLFLGASGRECFLKEEDRLAATAISIHEDCAISPKGAYFQNVDGLMEINPTYQGLSQKQGMDASEWVHTRIKRKSSIKGSGDFLDTRDVCKDVWSFRLRAQGSVCVLLNLRWLGFTAYHRLRTSEFGFVYFGDGIKSSRGILHAADHDSAK